jgi:hypothetical protein
MDDQKAEYLAKQLLALDTVAGLMFDLLSRHRLDLAEELSQDLEEIVRRLPPQDPPFLARTAQEWKAALEVQRRLRKSGAPAAQEQP